MSTAQLLAFDLERARAREIAEAKRKAKQDVSAEDILSLALKRELTSAEVDGVGKIYFYMPQSVAERSAYLKHVSIDPVNSVVRISVEGVVDAIIARVRNKDGKPLFDQAQRPRIMAMSSEVLGAIWNALGDERVLSEEQAKKK